MELRYGQIIRIHGDFNDQKLYLKGLITSKGFTCTSAFYQIYSQMAQINNYREALFQLLPKGSFEIHDEYIKKNCQDDEKRLKTEREQYNALVEQKINEEILFGQEIVLMHLDSLTYLSSSNKCCEKSTEAFRVELSEYVSSFALFKIVPYNTFQKEGQVVFVNESIRLLNEKQKQFLDIITSKIEEDDCKFKFPKLDEFIQLVRKPSAQEKYEVVLKSRSKASWKLKLHQSVDQIKQKLKIQPYDLITFQCTYNNSYLGVQNVSKGPKENDLKIVLREIQNNQIPLDGIWEFQQLNIQSIDQLKKDTLGGSCTMNSRFEESSPVQFTQMTFDSQTAENQYILRHYMTGKVLAVSEDYTLQLQQIQLSSIALKQFNYCFQLQLVRIGAEQEIQYQSYVFLKQQKNFLQIRNEGEWKVVGDQKFKEVSLTSKECMHAFQILKVPLNVQSNIQFVLSVQEQLFEFTKVMQKKHKSKSIIIKIQLMMIKLVSYLQISNIQTKLFRQNSMKELFVLDLIVELMQKMDDESEKLENIQNKCFEFIRILVNQNSSIKSYMSKYIEFFLDQALKSDQPIILKCLFEILKDNFQVISKFIPQKEVAKIIKKLKKNDNYKFLRILSALCVCKKKAVPENQNFVLENYFLVKKCFEFKIIDEINIIIVSDKEQTLEEMIQSQNIQFFRCYITLLANICTNRNQKAQEFVQQHFPSEVISNLIRISLTSNDRVLQCFLKLFHRAYIDQTGLRVIQQIEKVFEWDKLELLSDMPKTESIPFQELVDQIMQFAERYIDDDLDYDKTLLYVLRIIFTTLSIGFRRQRDEMQQIVYNLQRICSYKNRLNEVSQQQISQKLARRLKKKHNLLFKCKILSCRIIERIYELDTGIRLNKLMQSFKFILEKKKLEQEEIIVPFKEKIQIQFKPLLDKWHHFKSHFFSFQALQLLPEKICFISERVFGKIATEFFCQYLTNIKRFIPKRFLENRLLIKKGSQVISSYIQHFQSQSAVQKLKEKIQKLPHSKNITSQSSSDLQLLFLTFQKILKDSDLLKNSFNSEESNFDLILVEYSFFKNPKMLKSSLSLLNKLYQKRKNLFSSFSELLILDENENQQTKKLCLQIQNTTNNLKKLEMRVFRRINQLQEFDHQTIQDLNILCNSLKTSYLKNDGKVTERITGNLNIKNGEVRLIFDEYEQNEVIHQELMKTLEVYEPILKFLEVFRVNDNDDNLFKLLDISYELLTLLIWNNAQNQSDIKFNLEIMYRHIEYNICCIDFLRELFHHNKNLLYNEAEVLQFIKSLVNQINRQPITSYFKSKLMDSLRVLQYDQNQIIKANQLVTLQTLQDKKYSSIIFSDQQNSGVDCKQDQLIQMMEEYSTEYKNVVKDLMIRPEVVYLSVHFEVLSLLVENNNSVNLEKCRAMHSYVFLLNMLSNSRDCWLLENFIRAYVNRLYYQSSNFDQLSYLLVQHDLINISNSLHGIVKFKLLEPNKQNIAIKNPVRFNYMATYVFMTLQQIIYSLSLVLVNEQFLLELEDQLDIQKQNGKYEIHRIVSKILVGLDLINKIWFKNTQVKHHTEKLYNLLKVVVNCFTCQDLEIILNRQSSQFLLDNQENRQKLISQVIEEFKREMQNDSEESLIIQQTFKLKKVFYKKTILQLQRERQREIKGKNIKHKLIVNQLNQKKDFIQFLGEEAVNLCDNLDNMSNLNNKKNINIKEFITNVIEMNISSPKSLTDELRVFFLTVLVRMIEKTNRNPESRGKSIAEWTPETSSDCMGELESLQNMLDECGSASLIYELFLDSNLIQKQEICSQLILFMISYLYGGNSQCQNSLLIKLRSDQTNVVLTNFCNLLNNFSKLVYSASKSKNLSKLTNASKQKYLIDLKLCSKQLLENFNTIDNLNQFSVESDSLNPILPSSYKSREIVNKHQQTIEIFRRSFRMLQLLCENNNSEMKNFLREQTDKDNLININSVNFIELATKEFRIIIKFLKQESFDYLNDIAIQIVEFINEIVQLPCQLNQRTLCRSTYFEDASQYIFNSEKDLHDLQSKIIQSILLVLEGNSQTNYEDLQQKVEPKSIAKSLESFIQAMDNDLKKQLIENSNNLQVQLFPESMQLLFDVCIIMKKIELKYPNSKWVKDISDVLLDSQEKDIFEFCMNNLSNIEIFYEGSYQTIYFPSHPVFQKLSGETRDKIMFEIPRETQREKLVSLLQQQEIISNEIEYYFKLSQQIVPITHQTIILLVNSGQWISFLINVLMVIFYDVTFNNNQAVVSTGYWRNFLLRSLSIIQLIISVLIFSFYIISRAPLELKKRQTKKEKINVLEFFVNQVKNFQYIIQSDDFLQYLIYLIISGLGVLKNTYYFSVHLFYLFGRLELLKSVFQAISHNAKQLTMVAMLGVLFQFVFSIVAFYNYVDDIYQEAEPEDPCQSLISCMITLMTSGVIGTSMSKWDPQKFIYDTLYFVFFALLFTNIISGIMIDTFAELRDKRQKVDDDKKNLCFVCGIERVTLEKQSENFEEHIKSKHFLWNYCFYLYSLKKKDSTEYTGLEYWINDKVEKENITWFPMENSEETNIEQNLKCLNEKIDEIMNLSNKQANTSDQLVNNGED